MYLKKMFRIEGVIRRVEIELVKRGWSQSDLASKYNPTMKMIKFPPVDGAEK